LFAACTNAVAFGASPATLHFQLSKGGSEEKSIIVSTASEIPINVEISVSDEIKSFIEYSPTSNLEVDIEHPLEIKVLAKASRFSRSGVYEGYITIKAVPTQIQTSGTAGSTVATGVAVKTIVEVAGRSTQVTNVDLETENLENTGPSQEVIPLSTTSSHGNFLIVFVIVILIGCIFLVLIKFSKRGK